MGSDSETLPPPGSHKIQMTDDLGLLLAVMPPSVRAALEEASNLADLLEVVLDLGRPPEARYPSGGLDLSGQPVTQEDLAFVVSRVGAFGKDHRAGIERTLHRISAIPNRGGAVVGLTCRVGRAVFGTVDILRDVIEAGRSMLLLGRPGVGKTTLLRESARVLADDLSKRVVVVDTSNEIAGDGDIPHPGIGRARRMQVSAPEAQHGVMIEAVENHMPEVIVIDEIGTEAEAMAARTIAERGVQLIATAHGNTLENLLQNPTLSDLVGGIQAVTLSDEEARRRGTQKTVLERKAPPTFEVVVEIQGKDRLAVHHGVADVIDLLLRDVAPRPEVRQRGQDGRVEILQPEEAPAPRPRSSRSTPHRPFRPPSARTADREPRGDEGPPSHWQSREMRPNALTLTAPSGRPFQRPVRRIFAYAVSRNRLERGIRKLGFDARVVHDLREADVILTTKSQERRQPQRLRDAQARGKPLYVIKSNTVTQIESFLLSVLEPPDRKELRQAALAEAERVIETALEEDRPVELAPQDRPLRRLQHELIHRHGLSSRSRGEEPFRRVVVFPG